MTVAIANDHAAFKLKKGVAGYLDKNGIAYKDMGAFSADSCDYPDFAFAAAEAVARGGCEYAVLLCGTGIGMSIAANKVRGIRAALAHDEFTAARARSHNDANVLCMGESVVSEEQCIKILDVFLNTAFEGGRHSLRVNKINAYDVKR